MLHAHPLLILLGFEACIKWRPFDVWLIWVISIEYRMSAVSQSLEMSVHSTFEGVDGRCVNNMVWQCISSVHYPVADMILV